MSDENIKAQELYQAHGLKKANFIAFDQMQRASKQHDIEYWLRVINQIALIDITSESKENESHWGNA